MAASYIAIKVMFSEQPIQAMLNKLNNKTENETQLLETCKAGWAEETNKLQFKLHRNFVEEVDPSTSP